MAAAVAKAPASPFAGAEIVDLFELNLHDRDDHQLGNTLTGLDGEGLLPAIPAGYHQFALIIGVDQPYQIAKHNAVFVAQPGASRIMPASPGH